MVKGRNRLRSGVIVVEGEGGKTWYRCSCDRCNGFATLSFRPGEGREVLCDLCMPLIGKAKSTTRVIRRFGKTTYATECDDCGTIQKTPFMPKRGRQFLCETCMKIEVATRPAPPRVQKDPPKERAQPALKVEPAPDQPGQEQTNKMERPDFEVACNTCGQTMKLRFMPPKGDSFECPRCYHVKTPGEKRIKNKAGTRIFFNIDCIMCGKKETVDFVPQNRSEAICSDCFKAKRRRKKHG